MTIKKVKIRNELGMHARPAASFVQEANKYEAQVIVSRKGEDLAVDGRSILGLLSLGLSQGETIVIKAEGSDAKAAVKALVKVVKNFVKEDKEKKKN